MSGSRDSDRRGPASRRAVSRDARTRGATSRGAAPSDTEPQGAGPQGAELQGAEPQGAEPREAGSRGAGSRDATSRGASSRGAADRDRGSSGSGSAPAGSRSGATAVADRPRRPAARDAERVRFRRRRFAAGLVAVLVLLAVLAGVTWWALGEAGPGTDEVRVVGVTAISADDVRSAAAVPPGVPLAGVDTGAVAARVAAIPGVADVEVTRSWPHALTITVSERIPVAVVDVPGEPSKLVDVTGLPFRDVPAEAPRLPRLQLPRVGPDDPVTRAAVAVVAALPQPVRDQVDSVSLGPTGATLELALTGGRRVLWGRWDETDSSPGPASADTARRAAVLGPLLTREGTVYDVSSPELPTVRR